MNCCNADVTKSPRHTNVVSLQTRIHNPHSAHLNARWIENNTCTNPQHPDDLSRCYGNVSKQNPSQSPKLCIASSMIISAYSVFTDEVAQQPI